MANDFKMPDLGEGIAEAQIISVLVKEGDSVDEDQYLMEVETDKAAVEIPSPHGGKISKLHVKEGQTVNVGDVIVTFDGEAADGGSKSGNGAATASAPADAPKSQAKPAAKPAGSSEPPPAPAGGRTKASAAPIVRKLAREKGIDIDAIQGSGPGGRVTREDVERAASGGGQAARASGGAPATAAPPPAETGRSLAPAELPAGTDEADKHGEVRQVALTQIRKTIANQMAKSYFTIPAVTNMEEVDIIELERLRKQINETTGNNPKLTVMAFVIRALAVTLRAHPVFNSSFDEENGRITYKKYINIGIAVDTERGLVVPVIRNADQLSMSGIAAELRSIADRVRSNQFAIEDLRGGTFTITNYGALGGLYGTPIINHPEVAILGLGRARRTPVFDGDELREAKMMPVSLTFDHRATDGANAARFTNDLMMYLQQPELLLLH